MEPYPHSSDDTRRAVLRFWRRAAAFWAPLLLLLAALEAALWMRGDTWTLDRVIAAQAAAPDVLFLRRFIGQDFYGYKMANVASRRPEILAVGSSRVMAFRREMFGEAGPRFYNAGGAVQNLPDLRTFARILPESSRPRLIVLGIDMWWLNPSWREVEGLSAGASSDAARNWAGHLTAVRTIASAAREFRILTSSVLRPASARHIGIGAHARRAGFREDGSMDFGPAYVRPPGAPFVDRETPPVLDRIRAGSLRFEFADALSEPRLAALVEAVTSLERGGTVVVAFLPPVSTAAADSLARHPRHAALWSGYRTRLPDVLRALGVPVIDASTPAMLGLTDETMIDGFHGDERFHAVLTKRILALPEVRKVLSP